jgi:hypothetical protein
MVTYDPYGMTWDQWVRLMDELFSANQLGTVPEERWKDWAAGLNGIGYFAQNDIPDPRSYTDWRIWAQNLVGIMNVYPGNYVL